MNPASSEKISVGQFGVLHGGSRMKSGKERQACPAHGRSRAGLPVVVWRGAQPRAGYFASWMRLTSSLSLGVLANLV